METVIRYRDPDTTTSHDFNWNWLYWILKTKFGKDIAIIILYRELDRYAFYSTSRKFGLHMTFSKRSHSGISEVARKRMKKPFIYVYFSEYKKYTITDTAYQPTTVTITVTNLR